MTTQPVGAPKILEEDPGPWAVASSVFAWAGSPGRRRQLPPMGLMLSPAPTDRALVGLDPESPVAGVAPVRIVAGARQPAHALRFDGDVLHGVSPFVRRKWALPDLGLISEERPGDDPAADLPPAVHPAALDDPELPGAIAVPGGEHLAVYTREPRAEIIAILRADDRRVVRWIRGARAVAWSEDGRRMALGADWGVILAEIDTAAGPA